MRMATMQCKKCWEELWAQDCGRSEQKRSSFFWTLEVQDGVCFPPQQGIMISGFLIMLGNLASKIQWPVSHVIMTQELQICMSAKATVYSFIQVNHQRPWDIQIPLWDWFQLAAGEAHEQRVRSAGADVCPGADLCTYLQGIFLPVSHKISLQQHLFAGIALFRSVPLALNTLQILRE